MPIVNLHKTSIIDDGRQSALALFVRRGVQRLARQLGLAILTEIALPDGRRADLVGVTRQGEIWIVEIKSSKLDLRSDNKWPLYRHHCDRLFFASHDGVPYDDFPNDCGFILADSYGAHIVRDAPTHKIKPPKRKAMMLILARCAAKRLTDAELKGILVDNSPPED